MFHLAGFTQSQDSAVLANVAALADQVLQVQTNDIIVPDDLTALIGMYAVGPNLTRAQLVSPSIRRQWAEEIYPLDVNAATVDRLLVNTFGDNPIILDHDEQLNALMAENNAAASRGTILVWLADVPPQPATGEIRTIRVTSTGTAVANTWTNISLTFNDILPAGVYALVGSDLSSANMIAFRYAFKGGDYRPGFLGAASVGIREHPWQRMGALGVWGEFAHNTPPSVDVLCNGADASFAGVMDLMYLR